MTQNVNLLTEISIKPVTAFKSAHMLWTFLSWILLLLIIYAIAFKINVVKKEELLTIEKVQKELLLKVETLKETLAPFQQETSADLKNLLARSSKVSKLYNYLKELATYVPHGVWLTKITLANNNDITLVGNSVTSSGVSALVGAINELSSFENKKFKTVLMEKDPDPSSNNMRFIVSTLSNLSFVDVDPKTKKGSTINKPTDKIKETSIQPVNRQ